MVAMKDYSCTPRHVTVGTNQMRYLRRGYTINFVPSSVWLLIEGGSYSRVATIALTVANVRAIHAYVYTTHVLVRVYRYYIQCIRTLPTVATIIILEGGSYFFVYVLSAAIILGRLLLDVRLLFDKYSLH